MPKTRDWARDWSSISSKLSTIISAKAGAVPWWMAIIGMSFTSCGYGMLRMRPLRVFIHTG